MSVAPHTSTVTISRFELWWITLGTWVGGVFILTLAPVLFIPRLGIPLGMGASYLLFFLAWQPVQTITQRVLGTTTAQIGNGTLINYALRLHGIPEAIAGGAGSDLTMQRAAAAAAPPWAIWSRSRERRSTSRSRAGGFVSHSITCRASCPERS